MNETYVIATRELRTTFMIIYQKDSAPILGEIKWKPRYSTAKNILKKSIDVTNLIDYQEGKFTDWNLVSVFFEAECSHEKIVYENDCSYVTFELKKPIKIEITKYCTLGDTGIYNRRQIYKRELEKLLRKLLGNHLQDVLDVIAKNKRVKYLSLDEGIEFLEDALKNP